jgi:hypothetical protein
MTMRKISLLVSLALGAWGQVPGGPPVPPALAGYFPAAGYEDLKQALGLTDAQVRQLQEMQKEKQVQSQALYQQMAAKQKQLNDMLNADSTDALALGNLEIEVAKLRKQAGTQPPIKGQALAVLNDAQRAKLADLQNALKLQRAAGEAMGLGLIDSPPVGINPVRGIRQ